MILSNEELQVVDAAKRNARKKDRYCKVSACTKFSIGGHVMPRSCLQHIATKGEVYVLCEDKTFEVAKKNDHVRNIFSKRGIGELARKGGHGMRCFCNAHDASIFEDIEQKPLTNLSKKQMYLFCYKSLLHEIIKQENWLVAHDEIRENEKFPHLFDQCCKRPNERFKKRLQYMNIRKMQIERSIGNPENRCLDFVQWDIDKNIGFFMSGCTSYFLSEGSYIDIFLTVIPQPEMTKIVVGVDASNKHVIEMKQLLEALATDGDRLKFISDCAIRNIETWGCSAGFYNEFIQPREDNILWLIDEYFSPEMKSMGIGSFNLFSKDDINVFAMAGDTPLKFVIL